MTGMSIHGNKPRAHDRATFDSDVRDSNFFGVVARARDLLQKHGFEKVLKFLRKNVPTLRTALGENILNDLENLAHFEENMRAFKLQRWLSNVWMVSDRGAEKFISQRHGILWIGVPKASTRSMIKLLQGVDPDGILVKGQTMTALFCNYPEAAEFHRIAIVRNPWARIQSTYRDKISGSETSDFKRKLFIDRFYGIESDMTVADFLHWLDGPYGEDRFSDRHWLSQYAQLAFDDGTPAIDDVWKMEDMPSWRGRLGKLLGRPEIALPHLNKSGDIVHQIAGFPDDQELIDIVARRYERDIEAFGYAFP